MNSESDFLTKLQHLQYRLHNKGGVLIRTCEESESLWFVNCWLWIDYNKYLENRVVSSDNKIRLYYNHVSDLNEAIDNCIKLLDWHEQKDNIKL